jgi:hypothetical protein
MFTWLNKQGVQSDQGFAVQFTGRFTAEYREHGKVITLDVESGLNGGLPCIILDPSAFERWDGEAAKIPYEQRLEMFKNVKEAMEFQGLKMVVEKGVGPASS